MAVHAALATMGTSLVHWGPLFAREPEPDPDLDEIPTGPMDRGRSSLPPPPPPRRSNWKPPVLLLLLLVIAGGTYLYMEPDTLRGVLPESVMDLLGEQGASAPPLGPGPLTKEEGSPSQPPATSPLPGAPGEPPASSSPDAMPPVAPPPGMPPRELNRPGTGPPPMSATASIPEPRYGEGQLVTIRRNPTSPDQSVALTADPAGIKPGPVVRAGTMVRVLDGDLQGSVWVYAVKTPDGTKGWLAEERLQATQP